MNKNLVRGILLVGTAAVIAWDIYLHLDHRSKNTITSIVRDASEDPVVPFLSGSSWDICTGGINYLHESRPCDRDDRRIRDA